MAEEIGAVADLVEQLMAEAGPSLRQLVTFYHSFVGGASDHLRPDIMPPDIVKRVSRLVSGQQEMMSDMITETAPRGIRGYLVELMRG